MRKVLTWHRSSVLAAWLSMVVGSTVALSWILELRALAAWIPVIFMMQFNTALCFILTGAAFAMMLSNRRRSSGILALMATGIATAFVFEDELAPGHGLDRLLIDPFIATVPLPGHMGTATAICFILLNTGIMTTLVAKRPTRLRIVLSAIVFMAATATLLGYALPLAAEGRWQSHGHMSPLTALCFATLAISMIFLRVKELGYYRSTIAATLGAASYLMLLLLTLFNIGENADGGLVLPVGEGHPESRAILSGLLVFSGIVYACLIVYAFRSAQRYRDMAIRLSESQQRLAAIIDTAVDGVITIDGRGTILSANRATETIFGYGCEEMLGNNVRMLMPEPYHSEHDGYMENYARTRRPKIIGSGREVTGLRKNGSVFPLDLAVARIVLHDHVIYSGIVRDISQRKQHERAIMEANAELEEFSYRTSHDLRSPVASSIGLTAIMRDLIDLDAPSSEIAPLVERMDGGLKRLDRLIQNITLLTRSRVLEEPDEILPLASAVRETIERLRVNGAGRQIDFAVRIPETLVISTKTSRLRMILDNLLSNAIKYADPKVDLKRVDVEAGAVNGLVELTVSDNGLGIDPRDESSMFQMFKRFHPGHSDGSGLGLYILRKNVEHLDGTVVYRRLDKGSRFVVRLPQRTHL